MYEMQTAKIGCTLIYRSVLKAPQFTNWCILITTTNISKGTKHLIIQAKNSVRVQQQQAPPPCQTIRQ